MLEVIQHKFPDALAQDDLQWPLITANGSVIQPPAKPVPSKSRVHKPKSRMRSGSPNSDLDTDDEGDTTSPSSTKTYWEFVASRYNAQLYDPAALRTSTLR